LISSRLTALNVSAAAKRPSVRSVQTFPFFSFFSDGWAACSLLHYTVQSTLTNRANREKSVPRTEIRFKRARPTDFFGFIFSRVYRLIFPAVLFSALICTQQISTHTSISNRFTCYLQRQDGSHPPGTRSVERNWGHFRAQQSSVRSELRWP